MNFSSCKAMSAEDFDCPRTWACNCGARFTSVDSRVNHVCIPVPDPRAARIATLERELVDQHRAHLAMCAKATEACSAAQARNECIAELETVLRDLLSAVAANAVSTPLVVALAAYYAQRVLNGEKP